MRSDQEQQVWSDAKPLWSAERAAPAREDGSAVRRPRPDAPGLDDMPAAAVAGFWIMILLLLVGALVAGLVVGGATALGWWLLRRRPDESRR